MPQRCSIAAAAFSIASCSRSAATVAYFWWSGWPFCAETIVTEFCTKFPASSSFSTAPCATIARVRDAKPARIAATSA